MTHLQEVHGQVGAGVDDPVAVALTEETAALGEEVEGALRVVHLQAGNLAGQADNQVLAALESLAHLLHTLLRTREGHLGCLLADAARTAGVLALQFVAALHNPLRRSDETDAPARHGVGLGYAVDDDHAVLQFGELGHRGVLTDVVDVLINLVGQDDDALVAQQDVLQSLQFLAGIDGTRGIAGRTEDEGAGARCDGGLQLLRCNLEVLLDAGLHDHGRTVGQEHHLRITYPVGGGDDDLVALVHQGHDGVADALLGTVGTENLGRCVVHAVLALQFVHDGLAQAGIAGDGRVAAPVVADGLDGGLLDVFGRVEVGFAHTHVDDVDALCLQFAAALAHGQRGAGRQAVESFR